MLCYIHSLDMIGRSPVLRAVAQGDGASEALPTTKQEEAVLFLILVFFFFIAKSSLYT